MTNAEERAIELLCEAYGCMESGLDVAAEMMRQGPLPAIAAMTRILSEAQALREAAWRDGWSECKSSLTEDEAFCLTEDVEDDAWLDSETRASILITRLTPTSVGKPA